MIKYLKTNKGFTLLELILSIAILSIIIVPISSMFINSIKTNNISNEKMQAIYASQTLMENIKALDEVSEENLQNILNEFIVIKCLNKNSIKQKIFIIIIKMKCQVL